MCMLFCSIFDVQIKTSYEETVGKYAVVRQDTYVDVVVDLVRVFIELTIDFVH